jgi:hypothetical protein
MKWFVTKTYLGAMAIALLFQVDLSAQNLISSGSSSGVI